MEEGHPGAGGEALSLQKRGTDAGLGEHGYREGRAGRRGLYNNRPALLSRLLKKNICFVGLKARHCDVHEEYDSFLAPRFNRGLASGAFLAAWIIGGYNYAMKKRRR